MRGEFFAIFFKLHKWQIVIIDESGSGNIFGPVAAFGGYHCKGVVSGSLTGALNLCAYDFIDESGLAG